MWWRTPLPPGHSSPCIWDEALFLTSASGSEFRVHCLEARTGKSRWERTIGGTVKEPGSALSSPASPTSCTDGERVISYFGPFGVVCHDLAGNELWRTPLPEPSTQHGVGSSPVLADELVILLRDQDVGSHLLALDKRTGTLAWRRERPGFRRGFCTPLVIGEQPETLIVAAGTLRMQAYRARDGADLWQVSGLPNEVCASPVTANGLVYGAGWTPGSGVPRMPGFDSLIASGDQDGDGQLARRELPSGPAAQHFNYMDADRNGTLTRAEYEFIARVFHESRNALLAVRLGGDGDVTSTHVAWRHDRGLPYVPSPLLYRGRIYLLKNGGLLTCLDASSGAVKYQEERLGVMGDNYASPVAADGRIAVASQGGTVAVVAAADALEVIARNPLGEPILASPALAHDAIYIRSRETLWAFRKASGQDIATP